MDRRDGLVVGMLATALIARRLLSVNSGVDAHHDGIMLKPALPYLADTVLEIAVPGGIANALGVTSYGRPLATNPGLPTPPNVAS